MLALPSGQWIAVQKLSPTYLLGWYFALSRISVALSSAVSTPALVRRNFVGSWPSVFPAAACELHVSHVVWRISLRLESVKTFVTFPTGT